MAKKIEYYEIRNTISEYNESPNGAYATLKLAKKKLKKCSDWFAPKGTGRIYRIKIKFKDNGKVKQTEKLVFSR